MIRAKAITFKLFLIRFSDIQLYKSVISNTSLSHCTCPHCKSTSSTFHSFYNRYLISFEKGQRVDSSISVCRVQCNSCRHTHAILPDIITPFGSYSLRFVITVLFAYISQKHTVAHLCDKYGISLSTLYVWKNLFYEHYNAWLSASKRFLALSRTAIYSFLSEISLPCRFFQRFGFSFLQQRNTTFLSLRKGDG